GRLDGREGRKHSAFQPADRRQAKAHEGALKRPKILAPQRPVVGEIEGACSEGRPADGGSPSPIDLPPFDCDQPTQGSDLAVKLEQSPPIFSVAYLFHS